jgi:soluble lytic murein transglycosylase-like protein
MSGKQVLCSFLGVLFALCMGSADARADIFVFTDDSGTPHFSDAPSDSRYRLFMHEEQPAAHVDAPQSAASPDDGNRRAFALEVRRAASSYQLDEALLHAVIAAESGYNSRVVSRKGAVGLMQLMPETARRYKVKNSFDPAQNINAGAHYLGSLMAQFGNNTQLALAAYNAGENNVRKYGGRIPPFPETAAYVPKVMDLYRKFRQGLR